METVKNYTPEGIDVVTPAETKIVTFENQQTWADETYVLRLTPEQYRFLEWLNDHEMLNDDFYWHDGKPEVEIIEI